jgi:flagellar biosynthesis/type III secretory pathway protein FliH
MSQFSPVSGGPGILLFDEDFDLPPPSIEPEVIQPVYSVAQLMAAREEAAQEARDAALAEAEASERSAARVALTDIAAQLAAARREVTALAEQSSEAVVRLLLDCFATAFPALSATHGPNEVASLTRIILPALRREPKIAIRINPHLVAAMNEELLALDLDLAARVRLVPTDALALGDARVTWENGSATRDTALLWRQIEAVLTQAGLLNAAPAPPPAAAVHAASTAKEPERVE